VNLPGSPPIGVSDRTDQFPVARAQGRTESSPVRPLWVWWHLLSLDAPTVAVVWCWFFAAIYGLSLPWPILPTLALGTWSVYVADRLLDGWSARETVGLRNRHWFYLRHRRAFATAWVLVAIPLAWLIFFRISPALRTYDVVLCLIGVAYFVLIHCRPAVSSQAASHPQKNILGRHCSNLLTKELAVGFLFPIATAIPTWTQASANRGLFAIAVIVLGAACWLNCVAIQTWEDAEASREVMHTILGAARVERPTTTPTLTELLGRHLSAFASIVFAISLALVLVAAGTRFWPAFASVALSAALFVVLIRNRRRLSTLSLRIAADAALLTPLLFLLRAR
jgi:hypothetical protein